MDETKVAALITPFTAWLCRPESEYSEATAYVYASTIQRLLRAADAATPEALIAANAQMPLSFRARSAAVLRLYAKFLTGASTLIVAEDAGALAAAVSAIAKPTQNRGKHRAGLPLPVAQSAMTLVNLIEPRARAMRAAMMQLRGSPKTRPQFNPMFAVGVDPRRVTPWQVLAASTWDNVKQIGPTGATVIFVPLSGLSESTSAVFPLDVIRPLLQPFMEYGAWTLTDDSTLTRPLIPKKPRSTEPHKAKELEKLVRAALEDASSEKTASG